MELVTAKQEQAVTSSRIVAEYFEKQHKDGKLNFIRHFVNLKLSEILRLTLS